MTHGIITSILLGTALLAPIAAIAQDRDRHDNQQQTQRYYDSKGKDWHEWNGTENTYYQKYNQENHRKERDFKTLSKRQQSDYFQWRHKQHDGDSH